MTVLFLELKLQKFVVVSCALNLKSLSVASQVLNIVKLNCQLSQFQGTIRQHKNDIQMIKEATKLEIEAWKNNYNKQQSVQLMEKERKLCEQFRKDRDLEIESVIERLEAEASEMRLHMETSTENRIR